MSNPGKEILRAAKSGDLDGVNRLLEKDAALVDTRDTDGSTPLHCAAWKGHREIVVALLKAGADVNAENRNGHWGTTALHAAAHANQAAIAEVLIAHGADPKRRDLSGKTPMDHTSFHRATAAAEVLKAYSTD